MCLSIPGKIEKIDGETAIVSYGSEKREARIIDESFDVGDFVIVANKIVLMKVTEKQAEEAIALWKKAMQSEERKCQ